MEEIMHEVREYAAARGIKPSTVLQSAAGLSGSAWAKWEAGTASCSVRTVERLRRFMRDNPAQNKGGV